MNEYDYDVVLSILVSRYGYNHNSQYSFDLKGTTCSAGYTVTTICKDCGVTNCWNETTEDQHPNYIISEVDLTEYRFCGGLVATFKCACRKVDNLKQVFDILTEECNIHMVFQNWEFAVYIHLFKSLNS